MASILGFLFYFFIGACVGSFVNVVANRYGTGLSFWRGRSFCFSCDTTLSIKDLFPVFSFLLLKGKCRYCGSKISIELFITEVALGLLSIFAALKYNLISDVYIVHTLHSVLSYFVLLFIFGSVTLITIYDFKHLIIPDIFLIILFMVSIPHHLLQSGLVLDMYLFKFFLFALVLPLPLIIIFLVSGGRWIGFGDVKYVLVIGFLFGLLKGINVVVLSFWIGAAVSICILFFQKIYSKIYLVNKFSGLTIKSEIPFGPFLSLAVVWGLLFDLSFF